jgi:F0F1-type ATP synthase beta subunit
VSIDKAVPLDKKNDVQLPIRLIQLTSSAIVGPKCWLLQGEAGIGKTVQLQPMCRNHCRHEMGGSGIRTRKGIILAKMEAATVVYFAFTWTLLS